MRVEHAPDVQEKLEDILAHSDFGHVNGFRIIAMRSSESKANAYARIWNLPKIWQKALGVQAYYVIEVLSQHYDCLGDVDKEKVLIHELMHVPKTFSGALVPHTCFGKKIDARAVNKLHENYLKKKKEKEREKQEE